MTPLKWQVCSPSSPALLSLQPNVSPLLVQLLHNRGISDPAQFEPFLAADERLAHDPSLLLDMDKAVTRVLRAFLGDETIAVYGDFDADGVTATVVLTQGLIGLGGRVITYIPHRVEEGHGLNHAALKRLKEQGATLVITVDCGISGLAEIEQAQTMGLDIIITDHHPPLALLPPALAIIDPKHPDSTYPFPELAGVGVAFKFIQALFWATHREDGCHSFMDLVALGTVADVVPLIGENRYLVKRGLEVLNRSQRPGLREMVLCAGLEWGRVDTENISFALGPRLNAGGRLDHAVIGYKLLTATSAQEAHQLANLLETLNAERQRLTAQTLSDAKGKLEDTRQPLIMVGDADYLPGVLGIVANKLVDEFYRPAIVFQIDKEITRGSGRSIPEFDLFAALSQCRDLFTRFGGHAQAAGFTMPSANLDQLHKSLLKIAAHKLDVSDLYPTITIDAEVPLSEIGGETYKLISMLAPFGKANPAPTFLSRRVKVVDSRVIGGAGEHLKLKLRQGPVVWDAIAFNQTDQRLSVNMSSSSKPSSQAQAGMPAPALANTPYLDIVYNLEAESWGGRELLRLNIVDFHPTS